MLNRKLFGDAAIVNEFENALFGKKDLKYWFDMKPKKFLHNIDTFYYSVKFGNDFRRESSAPEVTRLRWYFEDKMEQLEKADSFDGSLLVHMTGWESNLALRPFSYAGYYKYMLSNPDMFDIFLAPSVPPAADGGESVTCEVVVQIRSYCLWVYGVHRAYEMSFDYVQKMADYFGLTISFTQENRTDFCWHSNYLLRPDVFFRPDNFYAMRVDRFKGAVYHTAKVGQSDYEMDYIAMGKRSDKIFVRIYLKSKEVVEMGYKPWFFKVWLFNGLISRYDLYVYEKAFEKHSWKYIDRARLEFYMEYGYDALKRQECADIIEERRKMNADHLRRFADSLTPKINLIMNVEYQVMRRHSKSYCLIPFKDNGNKGLHKRIYDFLDNRALIIDYLTHEIFRLVKRDDEDDDSNKARRPDCGFWERLRQARLVDCVTKPDDVRLVREYNRRMNAEIVKQRALKSAVTLGIYYKGRNADTPLEDMVDALCVLNDNDIHNAARFKNKKLRQFSEKELAQLSVIESPEHNFVVMDKGTGEIR